MIKLRTAQKLFLEKVEQTRKEGNKKGILIFATGLGKTLASLSDALRVAKNGKILVIANNHNLLYQHSRDFKLLNKTKKIGFLYQSKKDVNVDILFANIMTLKKKKYLYSFKPNEFDYIIFDETHHIGAKSYKKVLDYFKPKFLLGMTATPNRTDQIDIMLIYDNNIIYQMDTFEAINKGWLRKYKSVFLWDKWCDYNKVRSYRLKNGHYKYFNKDLGRAYFVPERDKAIVNEFKKRVGKRKGIGFCIGVDESIRMAKVFNENGIRSVAIFGSSGKNRTMNEKKRNKILEDFEKGKYQMIFNCDVLGEGLHLPSVDVILKLRPTQSSIKDSQHNGRGLFNIEGLKINRNKYKKLLIIDWVGNYQSAYMNYVYQGKQSENKGKFKDIRKIIEMPIGCKVEFEERVIKEFNGQYNYDLTGKLQDAIKEFKKIYGNNKPFRYKLQKENLWIYIYFKKNKLLDKYCLDSNQKTLSMAIKEFKKIYGNNKPTRNQLIKEHEWIYGHFLRNNLMDKYCLYNYENNLLIYTKKFKKIYGNNKPTRNQLYKENSLIFLIFKKNKLLDKYCLRKYVKLSKNKKYYLYNDNILKQKIIKEYLDGKGLKDLSKKYGLWIGKIKRFILEEGTKIRTYQQQIKLSQKKASKLKFNNKLQDPNIKIISKYKPKTIIVRNRIERKGVKKNYEGWKQENFKTTDDKKNIRTKIISKINNGENVLLLESPELSTIKEIEKQNIKPKKIIIPNNKEFKKLVKAIQNYKTDLNIEIINTSTLQYLVDSEEKFDFVWLDYCGAFSFYVKDLDILFQKHLENIKLVLTYNLFDPAKEDDSYYFTKVIDYVLSKTENKRVRLINDISYRYKKNLYNIGFNIETIKNFGRGRKEIVDNSFIEELSEYDPKKDYGKIVLAVPSLYKK